VFAWTGRGRVFLHGYAAFLLPKQHYENLQVNIKNILTGTARTIRPARRQNRQFEQKQTLASRRGNENVPKMRSYREKFSRRQGWRHCRSAGRRLSNSLWPVSNSGAIVAFSKIQVPE
jgi:hypothetical protein